MIWTQHDTEICERAEASGIAINIKTGKPLSFDELQKFALEFDKVRDRVTIKAFMKDNIVSMPWNFKKNKPLQ